MFAILYSSLLSYFSIYALPGVLWVCAVLWFLSSAGAAGTAPLAVREVSAKCSWLVTSSMTACATCLFRGQVDTSILETLGCVSSGVRGSCFSPVVVNLEYFSVFKPRYFLSSLMVAVRCVLSALCILLGRDLFIESRRQNLKTPPICFFHSCLFTLSPSGKV